MVLIFFLELKFIGFQKAFAEYLIKTAPFHINGNVKQKSGTWSKNIQSFHMTLCLQQNVKSILRG
jgi:hypothetical protein